MRILSLSEVAEVVTRTLCTSDFARNCKLLFEI